MVAIKAPKGKVKVVPQLITMGPGYAGKTCTIGQIFQLNPDNYATALNQFMLMLLPKTCFQHDPHTTSAEHKEMASSAEAVKVKITDTAGQEEYAALRTNVYKNGGLHLILFLINLNTPLALEDLKNSEKCTDNDSVYTFIQELRTSEHLASKKLVFILNKEDITHESNTENEIAQCEAWLRDTFGERVLLIQRYSATDKSEQTASRTTKLYEAIYKSMFDHANQGGTKKSGEKKPSFFQSLKRSFSKKKDK